MNVIDTPAGMTTGRTGLDPTSVVEPPPPLIPNGITGTCTPLAAVSPVLVTVSITRKGDPTHVVFGERSMATASAAPLSGRASTSFVSQLSAPWSSTARMR